MTPEQFQQLQNQNVLSRAAVLANAVEMTQQIYSSSFDPDTTNTINVVPRNVGLIKGFIVQCDGNLENTGMMTAADRTNDGAANFLKNVTFQDLNNVTRINTSGRHISTLNTIRQGFGFGGNYNPNLPSDIGSSVYTVQSAPSSIAAGANSNIRQIYYIPLAYAADDLRGSVYGGVTSANMNLQLQVNPSPVIAGGDELNAIYKGNTGGWNGNVTITVYQVYLDQLPVLNGQLVLPALDLNNIYELKETALTGMSANVDFPYAFANFRDFLSTLCIYDQNGTYAAGTDINYWSLVSANFTQLFKVSPTIAALNARNIVMGDLPPGHYYFDYRRRPINTVQFGNMELSLNAATAAAQSSLIVSTEAFAQVTNLAGASLSAG